MIERADVRRELITESVALSSFRGCLSPSERWQLEGAILALAWVLGHVERAPVAALFADTIAGDVERQAAAQLAEQIETRHPVKAPACSFVAASVPPEGQ